MGDIDLANAIAAANSPPMTRDALPVWLRATPEILSETALSGISDLEGQQDIAGQTAPPRVA